MDYQLVSNIALSVLSFVLALMSVCIAVFTLRQNSKMIEATTRPYVGFKIERINTGTVRYLFVLRNYGTSAALIESFEANVNLKSLKALPTDAGPFERVTNTTLMPGQQLATVFEYSKLKELTKELKVRIAYKSLAGVQYEEEFPINIVMNSDIVSSRTNTKEKEMESISYSLQELVERSV